MATPTQLSLPFETAEGSHAERRNLLGLALLRVGCDCHLSVLVLWIFNADANGDGLVKSYKELAAAPWGLCCSTSKARTTVGRARHLGLIQVAETRYVSCGQRANRYRIDWEGVRRVLAFPRAEATPPVAAALTRQGDVSTRQPHVSTRHPYIGINSLFATSLNPEPEPEGAAGAGPEVVLQKGGVDQGVCDEVPELTAALGRTVDPLPPRSLVYGPFARCEGRFLTSPLMIVEWFRRQLSLGRPVCGPTEAELLLVLAAALRATRMPDREIQSTRPGVFVGVVSHRRWRRALPHVPEARRQLDEMLAAFGPGLFHAEQFPPPRSAEVSPTQQAAGVAP